MVSFSEILDSSSGDYRRSCVSMDIHNYKTNVGTFNGECKHFDIIKELEHLNVL